MVRTEPQEAGWDVALRGGLTSALDKWSGEVAGTQGPPLGLGRHHPLALISCDSRGHSQPSRSQSVLSAPTPCVITEAVKLT